MRSDSRKKCNMKRKVFSVLALVLCLMFTTQMAFGAVKVSKIGKDKYKNCVLYARSRVRSLPYGLFSYKDKLKIINSKTPKVGSVAIIYVPSHSYGHVAVVTKVSGNKITIEESNWDRSQLTRRTGTAKELRIKGYFRPKKKWSK